MYTGTWDFPRPTEVNAQLLKILYLYPRSIAVLLLPFLIRIVSLLFLFEKCNDEIMYYFLSNCIDHFMAMLNFRQKYSHSIIDRAMTFVHCTTTSVTPHDSYLTLTSCVTSHYTIHMSLPTTPCVELCTTTSVTPHQCCEAVPFWTGSSSGV